MGKPSFKNWAGLHQKMVDDSGLVTEFITHAHEPGKIYTRTTQPDENRILNYNQKLRNEKPLKDLSFGRWIANIPFLHYMRLRKKYPDLKSKDKEIKQRALNRLMRSPEFKKYLV